MANTVSYTTIEGDYEEVEVVNVDGAARVFYMFADAESKIADSDVTVNGLHRDLFSLPAAPSSRVHRRRLKEPRTVVKMISSGTPVIEVQGLDAVVNL